MDLRQLLSCSFADQTNTLNNTLAQFNCALNPFLAGNSRLTVLSGCGPGFRYAFSYTFPSLRISNSAMRVSRNGKYVDINLSVSVVIELHTI